MSPPSSEFMNMDSKILEKISVSTSASSKTTPSIMASSR